jgi:hypothetical protein
MSMTKGERAELGQLIRKRERVMKAAARERSIQLIAEFDTQSAQIYSFDDDAVWKQAVEAAKNAAIIAQKEIEQRCAQLGIPKEFAPGVNFGWYGRGQNAVASRRVELRRMAKSRIEAMEQETIVKIERLSLAAQTEVIANGLQSEASKAFLENLPSLDVLMPTISAIEIKQLIDSKNRGREDSYGVYGVTTEEPE